MGLLKYARDNFLDNVAAMRSVPRTEATPATTVLRFSMESAVSSAVAIPAGCKVSNGSELYFETDDYAEIPIGATSVLVTATCTEAGVVGNGYEPGELSTIVNTLPYVVGVTNMVITSGGTDREEDSHLKEKVHNAPNSYSVAGPSEAYRYFAKEADANVGDVVVTEGTPGVVEIYFNRADGGIPDEALVEKVEAYLQDRNKRPLTDQVNVQAPEQQEYDVAVTYYIAESNKNSVGTIQAEVITAVNLYNEWQQGKIGRDINPDNLIQRIVQAGAKRVTVTSPTYTVLGDTEVAKLGTVQVTYGGLEDD